jgi:hypothetical protein
MRAEIPQCPRCRRAMQAGFMLDGRDNNRRAVAEWVEGAPERSFWMGLTISQRRVLPVTTWRCDRCGLLESYALIPPPP